MVCSRIEVWFDPFLKTKTKISGQNTAKMEFFSDLNIKPPPDENFIYHEEYYAPNQEDFEYDYEDFAPIPYSFNEILENCLLPTLEQGLKHVGPVIIWCV